MSAGAAYGRLRTARTWMKLFLSSGEADAPTVYLYDVVPGSVIAVDVQ